MLTNKIKTEGIQIGATSQTELDTRVVKWKMSFFNKTYFLPLETDFEYVLQSRKKNNLWYFVLTIVDFMNWAHKA